MQLLRDLYPGIDWKRVDFYEGLPWFTPSVAPYVTAQALPQFYSLGRFRIYLTKFDETRAQCLADIVHEAFHIMQAMHFMKGYGLGFFRGWMLFYIAYFIKYGYRSNPFEIPAYNQEYRFLNFCEQHNIPGISPAVSPDAFRAVKEDSSLVFPKYYHEYNENILLLFASLLFCIIITVLKPVIDGMIFILLLFVPAEKVRKAGQKAAAMVRK